MLAYQKRVEEKQWQTSFYEEEGEYWNFKGI